MRMNASQAETAYGTPRMTIGRWIRSGKLKADADGYFDEDDFKKLDAQRSSKPAPGRKTVATTQAQPKKPAAPKPPPKKSKPPAKKKAKKKAAKKKAAPPAKETKPAPPTEPELLIMAREHYRQTGECSIAMMRLRFGVGYNRAQRIVTALKLEQEDEAGQPSDIEMKIARNATSRQGVDLRKALANAEKAEMEVKIKTKDLISRELVVRVFRKIYTIDATEWRGLGPRVAPDIMAIGEITDQTKEVEISDLIERQVFRTLQHVRAVINSFLEEIESNDRVGNE